MTSKLRVVLDCDTANEIDDQFAIAYALGCPGLDVLGVISLHNTVAHGSQSLNLYHEEALRVVSLAGYGDTVPCLRGAATPLEDERSAVNSEGLEFLIECARQEPVTVLATGPATDVASLTLVAPDVREDVRVVWAGGFPDQQTWSRKKFGELNARADIAAWRRLTTAPGPLQVLTAWPGVERVNVDAPECAHELRQIQHPLTDYLAEILESWIAQHGPSPDMDHIYGSGRGKVLWDIVNVAAVHCPESVRFTATRLPYVDPAGVPDWAQPGREAEVGFDVDKDLVFADFWRSLRRLKDTTPAVALESGKGTASD